MGPPLINIFFLTLEIDVLSLNEALAACAAVAIRWGCIEHAIAHLGHACGTLTSVYSGRLIEFRLKTMFKICITMVRLSTVHCSCIQTTPESCRVIACDNYNVEHCHSPHGHILVIALSHGADEMQIVRASQVLQIGLVPYAGVEKSSQLLLLRQPAAAPADSLDVMPSLH